MTLASELVAKTKRHLLSGQREARNRLTGAINSSVTSVTFQYATSLPIAGSYVEVGLELMYVWSITGQTAEVQRAMNGSVAASHAAGATATINPKFPDFEILQALNDDLLDLSSPMNGLYAVRASTLTAMTDRNSYDLTGATNVLELISVRHQQPGQPNNWITLTNVELAQQSGSSFASGYSLQVNDGVTQGRPVRVLYKAGFTPLVNLTDDVELVAGLPATMHDIPPLGAAMRLVAPREIRRNFPESQGDTRRADEVPAGAVQGSMRGIGALRQSRITSEAARLQQQYPERGFIPDQTSGWW